MLIINDSKSTSFSSTVPLLENYKNIYWILGGQAKKGDKFKLSKKYLSNVKAYIYGKDSDFLIKTLEKKIFCQKFSSLEKIIKNLNRIIKKIIIKKLFFLVPAAASFDQFENFEQRGNFLTKKLSIYL